LLQVLFAFQPGREALTLADLMRRTALPRATVRRLALELVEAGALERHEDGRFGIGLRLWQLGTLAPRTESLRSAAQPFMEDLYSALRQHVQLAVLEGREAVIIERLSAPAAMEIVSQVGGRLPLHCSGVGKVLLSHGGADLVDAVLTAPLSRPTYRTKTDPAVLRSELAQCRRTGTATVREELTEGIDSVATRIMDGAGQVVAALSVVVRAGSVRERAVLPSLVASGLGISRAIGWHPGVQVMCPAPRPRTREAEVPGSGSSPPAW
jgi:DNA-binding IclR family transcriptional regulator